MSISVDHVSICDEIQSMLSDIIDPMRETRGGKTQDGKNKEMKYLANDSRS